MTTEELKARLLKLRAIHAQEIGARAGECAEIIAELIEWRAAGAEIKSLRWGWDGDSGAVAIVERVER